MKKPTGNIVLVVLAIGLGSGIWWQASANQLQRDEQSRLLMQVAELARLRNTQAQLKATSASPSDFEELQSEIDEVNRLRSRIVELKETEAKLSALNTPQAVKKKSETVWHNAGLASPADTVHSVIWAAINGEVETLMPMLAFDPESRTTAEALLGSLPEATRAQYPTVEKLIATMMSGRMATDFTEAQAIEQKNETADLISAKFQLKRWTGSGGAPREVTFRFQRTGNDWRLLVPKSVVDDYQQSLKRR